MTQISGQRRQVDSFGRLKIEYGSPVQSLAGPRVYTMIAEGEGGNASLGLAENGNYDILVDQTISIVGGAADAPPRDGLGIQLISKEGGIALTSEKGTIKINAKKLIFEGTESIDFKTDGKVTFDADKVHFFVRELTADPVRLMSNHRPGDVQVRDAGFMFTSFLGTQIGEFGF